ncbi:tetratricopeptide (TPR) repeat protein [Kitasatospora sp. GP30]|uniref:ATP-binding protein n=1 Tax=Kitasatospora sp. GP30 TaxID=3035084 RepID=UPI00117EC763|nr:ATP-binding protein [Kitasatospora sp. GP30]MDH6144180.1 tetratricopeptide (TPR) repeat protein [Kitasatospora sp. GP30]
MARETATMGVRPASMGVPPAEGWGRPAAPAPGVPEPFVGRAAELAALALRLRGPASGGGCRVLLVAGRPGSGRTSLARRFAATAAGDRRVLAVRLSDSDGTPHPPGLVAKRLLSELGEETEALPLPAPEQEDPACARLREALTGRDTLLLLDDVADAGQLRPLLPEEPRCLVLAVAARPLTGLADRFTVDPVILRGIDESAAVDLLTALVGGTRISCDPVAAAELAEACAGRPAPLRLLAGWLRAHPKVAVPEAGAALRAVAEERGTGAGDPLVAALHLRYRALPVAQARLLRMLTLAPGGYGDPRTASALAGCPAPEAVVALQALAEQELLDPAEPTADGTARYRVPGRFHAELVALREQHDRPAALQLARARLLERLIRLVDSARALLDPAVPAPDPLPGPLRLRGAAQARAWLAGERELLLSTAEQALAQGDLDGSVARLVGALLRTLPLTGPGRPGPADAYRLHQLVLELAERQAAPRRAAAALLNLADLRAAAGHWGPAAELYQRAVAHTREPRDDAAAARALEGVGECRRALGEAVRAADAYGRALVLRQHLDEPAAQARLLVRIAEAHAAQRRTAEAVREYRAALALLRRLGDDRGVTAVAATLEKLHSG